MTDRITGYSKHKKKKPNEMNGVTYDETCLEREGVDFRDDFVALGMTFFNLDTDGLCTTDSIAQKGATINVHWFLLSARMSPKR